MRRHNRSLRAVGKKNATMFNKKQQIRYSFTGKTVVMAHQRGKWTPTNGRWVKCKSGVLTINVLCHDTDENPPKQCTEWLDSYINFRA